MVLIILLFYAPVFLTGWNLFYLAVKPEKQKHKILDIVIELLTIIIGSYDTYLYVNISEVMYFDWNIQLSNNQRHFPLETGSSLTILVLALAGFGGYLIVRFVPFGRQPPLVSVLAMSAMYLGAGVCILWCIQTAPDIFMALFPINGMLLFAKNIRRLLFQRTEALKDQQKNTKLKGFSKMLQNASSWPFVALLAALPLLGVILIILILFGQEPDSVIRAWTQTADWNLSQQLPPKNIVYDQHYLCTVAARGHSKIVKPIRTGKRHGHLVLVNRQLCIANAFEQLLEERLPRLHRGIRSAYDRTGYPIAKHIHSPYAADMVYFIMKPLEWLFLIILYFFDLKPEDRIAVQYPHAPLPDINIDRTIKMG